MAETNVPITAGSGTPIATFTDSSSNRRQVIIIGDTTSTTAPVDGTNGLSVTLTTALPAGSAAIGKLAANSGVIIGDVNVAAAQTIAVTQGTLASLKATVTQVDSGGTSATDTTAHAVKVLQVDSTGATVTTAVAATTDSITAKIATDTIQNGLTALTPKFAKIAVSSSGVNSFIALVGGKKLRCLSVAIMGNGAVNVKFQSHVTPTDLTGLFYIGAAGGGAVLPFNPVGWFETVSGEAMDINLSGATAIGGIMCYVEV